MIVCADGLHDREVALAQELIGAVDRRDGGGTRLDGHTVEGRPVPGTRPPIFRDTPLDTKVPEIGREDARTTPPAPSVAGLPGVAWRRYVLPQKASCALYVTPSSPPEG
ncbi:hypothetical protein Val02_84830 [Virgisporangium aliadipatigenens]|uniref:Uncharacterized protein n=1 Tax=Virgisporangium aliadipatigenens TaxID=741659 RepID=A0A8J4DX06_9ACTN|nr:hypothetical protein Val02_84830 [Virgisporangium aliadipatigenens]